MPSDPSVQKRIRIQKIHRGRAGHGLVSIDGMCDSRFRRMALKPRKGVVTLPLNSPADNTNAVKRNLTSGPNWI